MPAPYSDSEQDALIDQLLGDVSTLQTAVGDLETRVTALEGRVDAIETTLAALEPAFSQAQADIGDLQNDSTTHGSNISTLQSDVGTLETNVSALDGRVTQIEGATVPAVDTVQDDVTALKVASKNRQQNDPQALGNPRLVLRPSLERVRRPDRRVVQRIVNPR